MQISPRVVTPLLLFAIGPLLSCAPALVVRPGCGKDTDCKGPRVCVAGTCMEPARAAPVVAATPPPEPTPPQSPPIAPAPFGRAGSQLHGDAHHTGRYAGHLPATAPSEILRFATQGTIYGGIALAPGGLALFGSHDHSLYAVELPTTQAMPAPAQASAPPPVTQQPLQAPPQADAGAPPNAGVACAPPHTDGPRWRRDLGDLVWATPAIGEGVVYEGSDDDAVYAIELASGAVRWRYAVGPCKTRRKVGPEGARCDVDGITLGPDGTIYASADGLYALSPDGTLKWKFSPGATTHCASTPAVADDGTVYVGCQDDTFYAIGPDGKERWDVRTGDDVDSSPAIGADGTVYFGSDDRKLWAIAPDGSLRFSVITGGPVRSSPAIGADGTVYVGSFDGKLYAIAPSGAVRWTYRAADRIASSPIVDADGAVAFGSQDDRLYALEPDGRLRWAFQLDGDVDGTATLADDGTLFIGADDRALHVLKQ